MNTRIRTALAEELDALQGLQWRCLRHGLAAPRSPSAEAALWRLRGVAPRHVAAGTCLVMEHEGRLVGLVAWQAEALHRGGLPREPLPPLPDPSPACALRALHLAPEMQGQGLGTLLLRDAECRIAAQARLIEALVPASAEGFFRRHGYVAISTHVTRLGPRAVLELRRMLRAVPPAGHSVLIGAPLRPAQAGPAAAASG